MLPSFVLFVVLVAQIAPSEAACDVGATVVSSVNDFLSAIQDQSIADICIDTFLQLDRNVLGEPSYVVSRSLTISGQGIGNGFNNSVLPLFNTTSKSVKVTLRDLVLEEGIQLIPNAMLLAPGAPGQLSLDNVNISIFCYDKGINAALDLILVYSRAGEYALPVQVGPTSKLVYYVPAFPMAYLGKDFYVIQGPWSIELNSTVISCIPGPPPYRPPIVEPIASLLPSQLVCQNRSDYGLSYRGYMKSTPSGLTCQNWTSETPQIHIYTPYNFPSDGLIHNYCRNPCAFFQPLDACYHLWCYTTDAATRSEPCDNVPRCEDLSEEEIMRQYSLVVAALKEGRDLEDVLLPKHKGAGDSLSSEKRMGIAVGIGCGGGILILSLVILYLHRRSHRPRADPSGRAEGKGGAGQGGSGSGELLGGEVPERFMKNFELPTSKIELVHMLDEGATGSVFLAKWDSNQVAVKVITNVGEKEGLEETVLGIMLIHPNVVRLFGYFVCSAIPARIVDSDNNTVRNTFIFEADKVDFVEPDVEPEREASKGVASSKAPSTTPSLAPSGPPSTAPSRNNNGNSNGNNGNSNGNTGAGGRGLHHHHSRRFKTHHLGLGFNAAVAAPRPLLSTTIYQMPGDIPPRTEALTSLLLRARGYATDSALSDKSRGAAAAAAGLSGASGADSYNHTSTDRTPASTTGGALSGNVFPPTEGSVGGAGRGSEEPKLRTEVGTGPPVRAVCIVMDWCDLGSLFHLLCKGGLEASVRQGQHEALIGIADVGLALAVARQVAAGMLHLHQRDIVHGDMKSLNVLLASSSNRYGFVAKLSDFGTASVVNKRRQTLGNLRVTRMYLAPEVYDTLQTSMEADLYAVGITLWELFHQDWMTATEGSVPPPGSQFTYPVPKPIAVLISECTAPDPAARPKIIDVIERIKAAIDLMGLGSSHPHQVATGARMDLEELVALSDKCPFVMGEVSDAATLPAMTAEELRDFYRTRAETKEEDMAGFEGTDAVAIQVDDA